MKKKIRLTETDLNRIIKRQVKKAINEISYGTVDDAQAINHNLFWGLQNGSRDYDFEDGFDNFMRDLGKLEEDFDGITYNFPEDRTNSNIEKIRSLLGVLHGQINDIKECANKINDILIRKEKQRDNFERATMDYDNAHENDDVSWDEYRKGEINNI